MDNKNIGILLNNIGTPDRPSIKAVRRYLKEFLSDRRVIELPPLLWWPILQGYILRTRPRQSARLYQKIWTAEGSPLLYYSNKIAEDLQKKIGCPVVLGMNYGSPSIRAGLEILLEQKIKKIIILPLFPQYSATTTASAFDKVTTILKKLRNVPAVHFINHYADHPDYINALANQIKSTWQAQGEPQHLLFSFHGIPQRYVTKGDIYPTLCQQTVNLISQQLEGSACTKSIAFQSRLGRLKWLTPYTDKILSTLPQQGISHLQVICPGFAVDCLETLEEIAIRGKEQFLAAGGKSFHYISALNNSNAHIEALIKIIFS